MLLGPIKTEEVKPVPVGNDVCLKSFDVALWMRMSTLTTNKLINSVGGDASPLNVQMGLEYLLGILQEDFNFEWVTYSIGENNKLSILNLNRVYWSNTESKGMWKRNLSVALELFCYFNLAPSFSDQMTEYIKNEKN